MQNEDLERFLIQDQAEMASEYERIRARSLEDPGTAGDEGEGVWRAVLQQWLPSQYPIRTKGRIVSADGRASKQVDLVVLRPGYPARLLDKKIYMAGGVVAAFECKNTLKAQHVRDAFTLARWLDDVRPETYPVSPFTEFVPHITFGILAHGHSWSPTNAASTLLSVLEECTASLRNPRDALTCICIANLCTLTAFRFSYDGPGLMPPDVWESRKRHLGISSDDPFMSVQYNVNMASADADSPAASPLGALIAHVAERLAHDDPALHPLVQYFHAAGMSGGMGGPVTLKKFPLSDFNPEMTAQMPCKLRDGRRSDPDWKLGFNY